MVGLNIDFLVEEYETFIKEITRKDDASKQDISMSELHNALVISGEWSDRAAEHLILLSKNYGAFFLRNALALAVALDIEDGGLRF
ncbi:MAG TPA: hypothetical protein PKH33_16370 [bacterium]|nr:hypothetical protein [bacterium]